VLHCKILKRGHPLTWIADVELRALQSLTAHIKLLMDAPEHLWRLLEKKKYLECAWLFLLARVVHRSLANDEGDEEGIWQDQNMDILVGQGGVSRF
jgi:hypothetical protein